MGEYEIQAGDNWLPLMGFDWKGEERGPSRTIRGFGGVSTVVPGERVPSRYLLELPPEMLRHLPNRYIVRHRDSGMQYFCICKVADPIAGTHVGLITTV